MSPSPPEPYMRVDDQIANDIRLADLMMAIEGARRRLLSLMLTGITVSAYGQIAAEEMAKILFAKDAYDYPRRAVTRREREAKEQAPSNLRPLSHDGVLGPVLPTPDPSTPAKDDVKTRFEMREDAAEARSYNDSLK